jgi:predicted phage tail protein
MRALLKSGKLEGTTKHVFAIDGKPVEVAYPITEQGLFEGVKMMTPNQQDRVQFEVASAATRTTKKRRAGELELEEMEKQLERKRHQEDLELHGRREELKKRALFGDDQPAAAPASDTGSSEDEARPAPAAAAWSGVFQTVAGAAAAAATTFQAGRSMGVL